MLFGDLTFYYHFTVYNRFSDFNGTGSQGRASLIAFRLHGIVSCYRGDDQPNYADSLA